VQYTKREGNCQGNDNLKKIPAINQSDTAMVQWCHGEMAKRIQNSMKGIDISEQRIGKKKFKILKSSN